MLSSVTENSLIYFYSVPFFLHIKHGCVIRQIHPKRFIELNLQRKKKLPAQIYTEPIFTRRISIETEKKITGKILAERKIKSTKKMCEMWELYL